MTKSEKEYLDKTYDMFRKHWIETNNVEESWERTKRLLHWYRIGLKDGITEQRQIDIDKACKWLEDILADVPERDWAQEKVDELRKVMEE